MEDSIRAEISRLVPHLDFLNIALVTHTHTHTHTQTQTPPAHNTIPSANDTLRCQGKSCVSLCRILCSDPRDMYSVT